MLPNTTCSWCHRRVNHEGMVDGCPICGEKLCSSRCAEDHQTHWHNLDAETMASVGQALHDAEAALQEALALLRDRFPNPHYGIAHPIAAALTQINAARFAFKRC